MPDLDLAELDRLHAEANDPQTTGVMRDFAVDRFRRGIGAAYPSLRARIAELERKEKAFDEIVRGICSYGRGVWIITGGDDVFIDAPDINDPEAIAEFSLLNAIESAISAAVAAKESKQ